MEGKIVSKSKPKIIVFSGGIGVGKSTLALAVANALPDSQYFEENVEENPYLGKFYDNMSMWSFHSRIAYLAMKAEVYRKIDASKKYIVLDRTVHELIVFAQLQHDLGNLIGDDYDTYWSLYETLIHLCPSPDLFVYVHCSIENSLSRIRERARVYEMDIDEGYLQKVNTYYREWISTLKDDQVILINTDHVTLQKSTVVELVDTLVKRLL